MNLVTVTLSSNYIDYYIAQGEQMFIKMSMNLQLPKPNTGEWL